MWKKSTPGAGTGFVRKPESKEGELGCILYVLSYKQRPQWKKNTGHTALFIGMKEKNKTSVSLSICLGDFLKLNSYFTK